MFTVCLLYFFIVCLLYVYFMFTVTVKADTNSFPEVNVWHLCDIFRPTSWCYHLSYGRTPALSHTRSSWYYHVSYNTYMQHYHTLADPIGLLEVSMQQYNTRWLILSASNKALSHTLVKSFPGQITNGRERYQNPWISKPINFNSILIEMDSCPRVCVSSNIKSHFLSRVGQGSHLF